MPSRSMHPHKPLLFLAPGAGLGHLVRTGGLCLELEHRGIPSLILTTSPLGPGFSQLTGLSVIALSAARYKRDMAFIVYDLDPVMLIQDTFPVGLYGEDLKDISGHRPWMLLCRHLRFSQYMETLAFRGAFSPPNYDIALLTEPLSTDHHVWVKKHAQSLVALKNPVCFPRDLITMPTIPELLKRKLAEHDLHLIVHSGPEHEIERLVACAQKAIHTTGKGKIAIINPRMAAAELPGCYDYFPAAALYPQAAHIYTGAGYNVMAEIGAYRNKHTALAFERNYDDQHWRINQPPAQHEHNHMAVKTIEALYHRHTN